MSNSKDTSSQEQKTNSDETVIEAIFDPGFYDHVAGQVKSLGLNRVEKYLLAQGFTEPQVKIILKRVLKTRGW
jgi:hypothetical protein